MYRVTSGDFQALAQDLDSRVHLVHGCWVTSVYYQGWAQDLDSRVHLWIAGAGSHLESSKSRIKNWIQEFIWSAGAGSHLDILKSGL